MHLHIGVDNHFNDLASNHLFQSQFHLLERKFSIQKRSNVHAP